MNKNPAVPSGERPSGERPPYERPPYERPPYERPSRRGRPRRGRPPGQASDARERIRDAARHRFMAEGYQDVTMRAVAADAGVDVALVSYYFESKHGLFAAALALPVNPLERIGPALAVADDEVADSLLRTFLSVWDDPETGTPLRAVAAAAVADANLARLVREMVTRELLPVIGARIGSPQRAGAIVTTMAGLIFTRYLLRLEPIASLPPDGVVALLGPVLTAAVRPD